MWITQHLKNVTTLDINQRVILRRGLQNNRVTKGPEKHSDCLRELDVGQKQQGSPLVCVDVSAKVKEPGHGGQRRDSLNVWLCIFLVTTVAKCFHFNTTNLLIDHVGCSPAGILLHVDRWGDFSYCKHRVTAGQRWDLSKYSHSQRKVSWLNAWRRSKRQLNASLCWCLDPVKRSTNTNQTETLASSASSNNFDMYGL